MPFMIMARMRCYSPRTGHDHGIGVGGTGAAAG